MSTQYQLSVNLVSTQCQLRVNSAPFLSYFSQCTYALSLYFPLKFETLTLTFQICSLKFSSWKNLNKKPYIRTSFGALYFLVAFLNISLDSVQGILVGHSTTFWGLKVPSIFGLELTFEIPNVFSSIECCLSYGTVKRMSSAIPDSYFIAIGFGDFQTKQDEM